MNNNYIIETSKGEFFGGWSRLGIMCLKNSSEKNLAYRMSKTVAFNNLDKVENFAKCKCKIIAI